jgi:two-component system NtrC family sensor kinase
MASLGKLAASVVHEINNPDCRHFKPGILLMKRISQRKESEGDTRGRASFDRYLTLMEAETRRISRIVSNLLTFSRQSQMEMGEQDVNTLIERTFVLNDNLLKIHNVQTKNGSQSRPAGRSLVPLINCNRCL